MISPAMSALTDNMFFSLFFSLPAMLYVSLGFSAETSPMFKRIMTQRKRYTFVVFGQLAATSSVLWVLSTADWSLHTLAQGVSSCFEAGVFGKILALAFGMTVLSPFMAIWSLCEVITRPSTVYSKVFGEEVYYTADGQAVEPVTQILDYNGLAWVNARGETLELPTDVTLVNTPGMSRHFIPITPAA